MAVLRPAEQMYSRFRAGVMRISAWPIWSLAEPLRSYLLGTTGLALAL